MPARRELRARHRWIAFATAPRGTLVLDAGAVAALRSPRPLDGRRDLLVRYLTRPPVLEVQGVSGVTAEVTLSSTTLIGEDDERIVIPNRQIVGEIFGWPVFIWMGVAFLLVIGFFAVDSVRLLYWGAGKVLAKAGIWAAILKFLVAAKKLLVVGAVAVGVALKRWFGRKE